MIEVVRFPQHERSLLDGSPCLRETTLINREFMATRVDRLSKPLHTEIGKFFSDRFQACANVVEFSCHANPLQMQTMTLDDSSPQ